MRCFPIQGGRPAVLRSLGVLASLVLMAGAGSAPAAEEPKRPPNIVVLISDDQGWHDIGYHGSEIQTPNLDRLARDGVRLERHYVFTVCSPTRAGILTGRNPSRFGIHGAIGGRSEQALPTDSPTLARALKGRGYVTALSGKWHLGLRPEVGPRKYGFDQTYGYLHGQLDPYTHLYKNGDRTWHRNDVFVDEKGHATDLITDEVVRFIETKRKEPFFTYVAYSVPHYPIQEEAKWLAPYKNTIKEPSRRLFAASVTHMDAAIGRIVESLEKTGQINDTLILFTSDNGGQRSQSSKTDYGGKDGPYPVLGDNRPLRGWKGDLYEGGVRVPAFVHWRGRLKPAVVTQTVSYLDWLPTLVGLGGGEVPAAWKAEGRNVWPLLNGTAKTLPTVPLYWNTGNWTAVLDGDWKLIVSPRKPAAVELYNLAADPAEEKNLAAAQPAKVEQLRTILGEQNKLDR